jgi:hypothetical protein
MVCPATENFKDGFQFPGGLSVANSFIISYSDVFGIKILVVTGDAKFTVLAVSNAVC